jgi:hypothetical protein
MSRKKIKEFVPEEDSLESRLEEQLSPIDLIAFTTKHAITLKELQLKNEVLEKRCAALESNLKNNKEDFLKEVKLLIEKEVDKVYTNVRCWMGFPRARY